MSYVIHECHLFLELMCYKKETTDPFIVTNDFFWIGQNKISHQLAKGSYTLSHEARLCFLGSGLYAVTAFAYFCGNSQCPVTERWLANDACTIEVRDDK